MLKIKSKHLKFTAVFFSAVLAISAVGLRAISTFPPTPDSGNTPSSLAGAAAVALYSGNPERAYRLVESALALESTNPEALLTEAAVYTALDLPMKAARSYSLLKGNSLATLRIKAIIQRQRPGAGRVIFKVDPESRVPMTRSFLRHSIGAAPSKDGGRFLLTRDEFTALDSKGAVTKRSPMNSAVDLSLDPNGVPLVLTKDRILLGGKAIPLPAGTKEPSSIAATPDGNLILLDSDLQKLFRLDKTGKPLGEASILIRKPVKVRIDGSGRLFVGDGDDESIHVFGADLSPLRIIRPPADNGIRRLEDFQVDFTGNILLMDGRKHELMLLSSDGVFLGRFGTGQYRVDAFGWDGLFDAVFVDRKAGVIGRVSL